MTVRAQLYRSGRLVSHQLPVPVISVGNLVLGGSGKTPVIEALARFIAANNRKPAIISRGYGGKTHSLVNVVADGTNILLGPETAGDEPAMLAQRLRNTIVLTGKKRIHPCRYAIEHLGAEVLLLDDGFQHLAVARDINLVLFDATVLAGNSRVFPAGDLREPVSALARADAFVLTGVTPQNEARAVKFGELLGSRYPGMALFLLPQAKLVLKLDHREMSGAEIASTRTFAFAGIANPTRFWNSLNELGINMVGKAEFRDHMKYKSHDIDKLVIYARRAGANCLLTTEKDKVKISPWAGELPLIVASQQLSLPEDLKVFLQQRLEKVPSPSPPSLAKTT